MMSNIYGSIIVSGAREILGEEAFHFIKWGIYEGNIQSFVLSSHSLAWYSGDDRSGNFYFLIFNILIMNSLFNLP